MPVRSIWDPVLPCKEDFSGFETLFSIYGLQRKNGFLIFFAFFALIFVIIGLLEIELLFAAAFFGIFALMFFVLGLSPKNMPCVFGRETGISKKAFVIICIVLAFLMPMLSNMVAAG